MIFDITFISVPKFGSALLKNLDIDISFGRCVYKMSRFHLLQDRGGLDIPGHPGYRDGTAQFSHGLHHREMPGRCLQDCLSVSDFLNFVKLILTLS